MNQIKLAIITGPSGSGKTRLSNLLSKNLKNALILRTDDYYKTGITSKFLSTVIKAYFDKPISFNKKLFKKDIKSILRNRKVSHFYKYDFIEQKRLKLNKEISKIDYLIIEGIFSLEIIKYLNKFNYILIRIRTTKKKCLDRVCKRDFKERGKNQNQSLKDFKNAWDIYIRKEKYFKLNNFKELFYFQKSTDLEKILELLTTNIS